MKKTRKKGQVIEKKLKKRNNLKINNNEDEFPPKEGSESKQS